jgi:hypothetical protein
MSVSLSKVPDDLAGEACEIDSPPYYIQHLLEEIYINMQDEPDMEGS